MKQYGFSILVFLFIFGHTSCFAQTVPLQQGYSGFPGKFSSAKIDTNRLLSDQPLKSPMGAVFRSAVLPGWGQVYTGHYLKAPVALATNAFLLHHIFWYHHRWRTTKNADFQGKRNLYTWYFSLAYLLTMVDAYVDAYLYKFDEAMEISQHIDMKGGQWLAEVRFTYHF
ncbi:MAG TPA: hypothetical protein ENK14_05090 [Caldithrix sp.]|nr:hypothetical protein [Caldithrix sp.]